MTRLVVDASAVVAAFAETTPTSTALRRRLFAGSCHAPSLRDAEVGSVARRMVLARRLTPVVGFEVVASVAAVVDLPLITADARLARAPGLPCTVELVSPAG